MVWVAKISHFPLLVGLGVWVLYSFFDYSYDVTMHIKAMSVFAAYMAFLYFDSFSKPRYKARQNFSRWLLLLLFVLMFVLVFIKQESSFNLVGILLSFGIFKSFRDSKIGGSCEASLIKASSISLLMAFSYSFLTARGEPLLVTGGYFSFGVFYVFSLGVCLAGLRHYLSYFAGQEILENSGKGRLLKFSSWLLPLSFIAHTEGGGVVSYALVAAVLIFHGLDFYWEVTRTASDSVSKMVKVSIFLSALGHGLALFDSANRVHWIHFYTIAGVAFSSLMLIFFSSLSGRGGAFSELLSGKWFYIISFFIFLAAFTRATAHLIPTTYISHLGYASFCVFLSVIIFEVILFRQKRAL